jgi:hypothetical protein
VTASGRMIEQGRRYYTYGVRLFLNYDVDKGCNLIIEDIKVLP